MSLIKSLSVGNGDMFYITHDSSNFTIIDCCMCEESKEEILREIKEESKDKGINRFISTHPDEDHFRGLKYLEENFGIRNFYCVKNNTIKKDDNEDFDRYCRLRDSDKAYFLSAGCKRKYLNESGEDIKSSGISILWPIVENEYHKEALEKANKDEETNNISPIIKYSREDSVSVLWFGDLGSIFMDSIKDEVKMVEADIVFAPHHGRKTGKIPKKWLEIIKPKIIVIGEAPSEHIDYYAGYQTITQNSAGDIIFDCKKTLVDVYASCESYSIDFLENNHEENKLKCYYKGTLEL